MTESQEKKAKGLVQVFTGNGKGKTTAALGTIMRAAGHGVKIFIVFFFKGEYALGEYATLPLLPGVTVASYGLRHLIDHNNLQPRDIEEAELALRAAGEAVTGGEYDLVVMDEVNVAIEFGLIKLESVIDVINKKPEHVELILTGRYAHNNLIEIADLVTEMVNVKHPFEQGIETRKGIDF